MANEYLKKEYELCFEQLRFYDERQSDMLKFTFSLASAAIAATYAVYKFPGGANKTFFACQAALAGVVFVATALLYLGMLQNRVYFVKVARQINAIRGHLMRSEAADFQDNQLWTSPETPRMLTLSLHTFQLLGVTLVSALFAGMSAYGVSRLASASNSKSTSLALWATGASILLDAAAGVRYLSEQRVQLADR